MTDATGAPFDEDMSLGALLREARESRGLDLSEVARQTHVRREYLAALEEGRYGDLPEDVYARNFLKLFAQAVGVDTVRALEIYRSERRSSTAYDTVEERLERDTELASEIGPIREERERGIRFRLPGRLTAALSTLLMVGAVVGLALWGFNSTLFNPSRNVTEGADVQGPAGAANEEPPETTAGQGEVPRTVRLSVSSSPPGAEVSIDAFPLPGVTPIVGAPVTARPARTILVTLEGYEPFEGELDLTFDRNISVALTPLTEESRLGDPPVTGPGGAAGPATGDTPAAGGQGAPAGPAAGGGGNGAGQNETGATLRITEDTWLEVYQGTARNQGQRLAFTTARAGQAFSFPLPIYIHVGNAGGVELAVNGQERGTLGSSGEVRGVAVTR